MATITATLRRVRRSRNAEETKVRTVKQCESCSGTGTAGAEACETCAGLGWVLEDGGRRIEPDADDGAQRFEPETNQLVSAKLRAYGARLIAGVTPGSRFPKTIT